MLILAVETSARPSSCAIIEYEPSTACDDGQAGWKKVISSNFINTTLTHSETLLSMIDGVLSSSKLSIEDIDFFAVASGPGSFTGVRIGVSAIKGLAFSVDEIKNCIGLSTLESMAYIWSSGDYAVREDCFFSGIICPTMDARRNQVYTALFRSERGVITRICDDVAIEVDELFARFTRFPNEPIMLVGDGALLCYNYYKSQRSTPNSAPEGSLTFANIKLPIEILRFQNAIGVGLLACERLDDAISSNQLMPSYLRVPQAERERALRNEKKIKEF